MYYLKIEIKFYFISWIKDDMTTPVYATSGSAAADICSNESIVIPPHSNVLVHTGYNYRPLDDALLVVCCRSGLAAKNSVFVTNSPAAVTQEGEIVIDMSNWSDVPFQVEKGMRIAQVMLLPDAEGWPYTKADLSKYLRSYDFKLCPAICTVKNTEKPSSMSGPVFVHSHVDDYVIGFLERKMSRFEDTDKVCDVVQLYKANISGITGNIYSDCDVTVKKGETKMLSTGVRYTPAKGTALLIFGVTNDLKVLNAPGIVDSDYTGEIKVISHAAGGVDLEIPQGGVIGQLMQVKILQHPDFTVLDAVRGDGGFGSTGTQNLSSAAAASP